jgi:hypothetical protein
MALEWIWIVKYKTMLLPSESLTLFPISYSECVVDVQYDPLVAMYVLFESLLIIILKD